MLKTLKEKIKKSDTFTCRFVYALYKFSWTVRDILKYPVDHFFYLVYLVQSLFRLYPVINRINEVRKENGKRVILFVNHEESRTGAPIILFKIAEELNSDFNVVLLSIKKGSMHDEFKKTFKFIIYPYRPFRAELKGSTTEKMISALNPDLIYINSLVSQKYLSVAKNLGIPVIFHIHELHGALKYCFHEEDDLLSFPLKADTYIAASEKVLDFAMNDLRCSPEKIKKIYEFVSAEEIIIAGDEISSEIVFREFMRKPGEKIILGTGSIHDEIGVNRKGLDILVEARDILERQGVNNIRFVWMGRYKKGVLKRLYKKVSGPHGNFIFLGEKENPYPYIKASDVFILPSREDPFPLVVLEAMAFGKPIIAFRGGGGAPEAIEEGCGYVVDRMDANSLAEAIVRLLEEEELMKKFSVKGPVLQKKYDRDIILPEISTMIRGYVNKRYLEKEANRNV